MAKLWKKSGLRAPGDMWCSPLLQLSLDAKPLLLCAGCCFLTTSAVMATASLLSVFSKFALIPAIGGAACLVFGCFAQGYEIGKPSVVLPTLAPDVIDTKQQQPYAPPPVSVAPPVQPPATTPIATISVTAEQLQQMVAAGGQFVQQA